MTMDQAYIASAEMEAYLASFLAGEAGVGGTAEFELTQPQYQGYTDYDPTAAGIQTTPTGGMTAVEGGGMADQPNPLQAIGNGLFGLFEKPLWNIGIDIGAPGLTGQQEGDMNLQSMLPLLMMSGRGGFGGLKRLFPLLALTGAGATLFSGLGALPMALMGGGTGAMTGYMLAPILGIDSTKGAIIGGLLGAGAGGVFGQRRSRPRTRVVYRSRYRK